MNERERNIHLNRLMVFINSVNLICFTILAVIFRHWWIILFSALFWTYEKKEK